MYLGWRRGDITPYTPILAQGLGTVASFGQHLARHGEAGGGMMTQRVSESSGLPLGEAGLGTAPCCIPRQGGMDGEGILSSTAPGAISLLKDPVLIGEPQVRSKMKETHGICKIHSCDFLCVCLLSGSVFSSSGLQTPAASLQSLQ